MDGALSAYLSFFVLMAFLLISNVILSGIRDLMAKKVCNHLREAHGRLVRLAANLRVDASFKLPDCPHTLGGERGDAD